jgi:hypothetical protein
MAVVVRLPSVLMRSTLSVVSKAEYKVAAAELVASEPEGPAYGEPGVGCRLPSDVIEKPAIAPAPVFVVFDQRLLPLLSPTYRKLPDAVGSDGSEVEDPLPAEVPEPDDPLFAEPVGEDPGFVEVVVGFWASELELDPTDPPPQPIANRRKDPARS